VGALYSAGADDVIKLWNIETGGHIYDQIYRDKGGRLHTPSSVEVIRSDIGKYAAGYNSGHIRVYDVATNQALLTWNCCEFLPEQIDNIRGIFPRVYRIKSHPTLPLLLACCEDGCLRFFDLKSGKCIYIMTAHQDAVTSADFDPAGSSILTSAHDSTLRLWSLSTKQCIQELMAQNQTKNSESIHIACYHPRQDLIASGSADATIKLFNYEVKTEFDKLRQLQAANNVVVNISQTENNEQAQKEDYF